MTTAGIIIITILSIATIALLLTVLYVLTRKKEDVFSKEGLGLVSDVGALKSLTDRMQSNIQNTLRAVEGVRQQYEESKKIEEGNFQSLKRLEGIIAGSKQKGIAGENIIRESLAIFPPDMIQTNLRVRGKEVEFGLVLSNKKVMPIDSKWPSTDTLDAIAKEEDPDRLERLKHQVQKEVTKRISEISQYLDPNITTPWAIGAIPDSAYSLCKDAHLVAYNRNVILVSYGMLLPYLLMFYSLHRQYASSIDMENLSHYLIDIKRNIEKMGDILENRIVRAQTILLGAADEYRQILSTVKGSVSSIETQKPKQKALSRRK